MTITYGDMLHIPGVINSFALNKAEFQWGEFFRLESVLIFWVLAEATTDLQRVIPNGNNILRKVHHIAVLDHTIMQYRADCLHHVYLYHICVHSFVGYRVSTACFIFIIITLNFAQVIMTEQRNKHNDEYKRP